MFCPKCGSQLADGVKFCKRCGASVAPETARRQGSEVRDSAGRHPHRSSVQDISRKHISVSAVSSAPKVRLLPIIVLLICCIATGVIGAFLLVHTGIIVKEDAPEDNTEVSEISAVEQESMIPKEEPAKEDIAEIPSEEDTFMDDSIQNEPGKWEEAYMQFIENKEYLNTSEAYFSESEENDYEPVAFAIYDMDSDGIPELLINNGDESYAGNATYGYSYEDGEIVYIGMLPGAFDTFRYGGGDSFPGLFIDGAHTGGSWTDYYFKKGDEILQQNVVTYEEEFTGDRKEIDYTQDDSLYHANGAANIVLDFVSESEYFSIGWDAFAEKYLRRMLAN